MKFLTVVGARPQFMKLWAFHRAVARKHEHVIVHTGQHYDAEMSDIFFKELALPEPDYNLGVGSDTHAAQTAKIMLNLEKVLETEKPDCVVVYGDTNSTLAGALTAVKMHLPVAHIEAGLRRYDLSMPEEVNRIVSDNLSAFLFAPTETAMKNLAREGLEKRSYLTGDVMYDAFLTFRKFASEDVLSNLGIEKKEYLLATIHRAENTDKKENLANIVQGLEKSGEKIVFPVHPRTKKMMEHFGVVIKSDNVLQIKPVGYLEMLALEMHAKKIITDSGGVQREAYFAGVPCITLLEFSEWVETVEYGWNFLAGTDVDKILWGIRHFEGGKEHPDLFGDGNAGEKTVSVLEGKI